MKTMQYLLIVLVAVVLTVPVKAQYTNHGSQQPQAEFRSTSVMMFSGSTLPIAAQTGVVVTGSTPYNSSAYMPGGGPRKSVGGNGGWEDEDEPDRPGEPMPIGNGTWFMVFLALAFAAWHGIRIRMIKKD